MNKIKNYNFKYTIFILKNDAIKRQITNSIIDDLKKHYKIIKQINKDLNIKEIDSLKEDEWNNNWKEYPNNEFKSIIYNYEVNSAIILLCKIKDKSKCSLDFGKKLKGNHYLAHLCDKNSIRGKYNDISIIDLLEKQGDFHYITNENGKIYPPNIIHSVDTISEFNNAYKLFFLSTPL